MVKQRLSSLPTKQTGFSLLEILVSFFLIAILGATTMNALLRNNLQTLISSREAQAMVYAREYAEMLRMFDFNVPATELTAWKTKLDAAAGMTFSAVDAGKNTMTEAKRYKITVVYRDTTAELIVEQRLPDPALAAP